MGAMPLDIATGMTIPQMYSLWHDEPHEAKRKALVSALSTAGGQLAYMNKKRAERGLPPIQPRKR